MGRKRTAPLPKNVIARPKADGSTVYAVRYKRGGKWVQETVGPNVKDAARVLGERENGIDPPLAPKVGRPRRDGMTLADFVADLYLPERRAERQVRTVEEIGAKFRDHILPDLGRLPLNELRGPHVARWLVDLRLAGKLAPKTIVNTHGALRAALQRAVYHGLIPSNPAAKLPPGSLPATDARSVPPFTRDQAALLVYDARIPWPHRIVNALGAFCGMRKGEAVGLRWRDLHEAAPLAMIDLRTQYGGRPLKGKPGRPGKPRQVPVHPELAALLDAWRTRGWALFYKREPGTDDFIAPNDSARSFGECFTHRAWDRQFNNAAAAVGIELAPGQGFHSLRRFFVSFSRMDGAPADVIERITHNAAGAMIDRYTFFGWETLCAAVQKTHVGPRPSDKNLTGPGATPKNVGKMLEVSGVEPESGSGPRPRFYVRSSYFDVAREDAYEQASSITIVPKSRPHPGPRE